MNVLIWYPKCSTCKNAKKYLEDNNIKFDLRDIKCETPNTKELYKLISLSNKDIKAFFNTSGLVYKKLNLLANDGMLIKRPILIYNDKVLVGFKKDVWNEIIK